VKDKRRTESILNAILESAAQAILTIDRDGKILSANTRTSEIFGYSHAELIGQPVDVLLPESARNAHSAHRAEYFAAPRVRPMGVGLDLSGRRQDGTTFPVEISLSYLESEGVAIAFVSDITPRKELESQLLQSQKMEAVGRLAGGIAHDFNNLLTIISGYDRMLLDRISPLDPLRGYAEEILKASDRATALTKQLLAFGRRQPIKPSLLDLNRVLTESQGMLRRLIPENIEVVIVPQPDIWNVLADQNQLDQVILNLSLNARDAMPTGGRLTIETRNVKLGDGYSQRHFGVTPGPYVMLAVSDNGSGMDAQTVSHIFEPFFTTKSSQKGTGLGLSIVYGMVKQNHGDIWVYSELGKGTTMKIYLPRAVGEATGAAQPEKASGQITGNETVLIVEDEDGVRKLITDVLETKGYDVLAAAHGQEAIELAGATRIDLLLTDVVLPNMNGRELANQLLKLQPEMKILFISGYTDNTIFEHGVLGTGANFLAKPFRFEDLLTKVREVLSAS
jgi:hypothetical protein